MSEEHRCKTVIIIAINIELLVFLYIYAIPLGVGSVNSSCMGSSVCCQAPINTTYGRGEGEMGCNVDTCNMQTFWQ